MIEALSLQMRNGTHSIMNNVPLNFSCDLSKIQSIITSKVNSNSIFRSSLHFDGQNYIRMSCFNNYRNTRIVEIKWISCSRQIFQWTFAIKIPLFNVQAFIWLLFNDLWNRTNFIFTWFSHDLKRWQDNTLCVSLCNSLNIEKEVVRMW